MENTEDFVQATSENLPEVYTDMILEISDYEDKSKLRSGREFSKDNTIGFVKLKRIDNICTISAVIFVSNDEEISVSVGIDEINQNILTACCGKCSQKEEICCHSFALLLWLERKTIDNLSSNEIKHYWKTPKKDYDATDNNMVFRLKDIRVKSHPFTRFKDCRPLTKYIKRSANGNHSSILVYHESINPIKVIDMDNLIKYFKDDCYKRSHPEQMLLAENFWASSSRVINQHLGDAIFDKTSEKNYMWWYRLRYGRISASKFFEAINFDGNDNYLLDTILGATSVLPTKFEIKKQLKLQFFEFLKSKFPTVDNCGIYIDVACPIFVVYPDAVSTDCVFEFKCVSDEKPRSIYMENGKIQPKIYYELQLQMKLANKEWGYLCIIEPDFEHTQGFELFRLKLNNENFEASMEKCKLFWKKNIFNKLLSQ